MSREDADESMLDDGPETLQDLPTRQEGFTITDDGTADWALRIIQEAETRVQRDKATVEAEISRWRTWQAKRQERYQANIDRMQSLLRAYYDQLKASGILGPRSKTYRLPSGVLQTRMHGVTWHRDDSALLAWAKATDPLGLRGFVRAKEEPAWSEIVKRLAPTTMAIGASAVDTATGEIVPGIQVQALGGDVFQARPDV